MSRSKFKRALKNKALKVCPDGLLLTIEHRGGRWYGTAIVQNQEGAIAEADANGITDLAAKLVLAWHKTVGSNLAALVRADEKTQKKTE